MQTPEQAKAAGEKLRQILLQLAMTYDDVSGMLDGSKARERLAGHIKETIGIVREQIRPAYSKKNVLLFENARAVRTFDFERERLWQKAIRFYLNSVVNLSAPDVEKYLEDPAHASILDELRNELRTQLETFTVPLLEKLGTPGDDFLLYTYALMIDTDEKTAIDNIASTGKTPPELVSAFFGMFGLLIEATRAKQQGDMDRAYSFLLDANHLIGMHESARYVMKHLPEVAKKRRAQLNSAKSREQVNKAKVRAFELFSALRPSSADGKPQRWEKANDAAEAVWGALEAEAYAEDRSDPGVSYSTVLSLCQKLHKLDKNGGGLDIRVEVVQRLPDGTERKVTIV